MDASSDWERYFHLSLAPSLPPEPPLSLRDQLFPRCRVCGVTCGETWSG